MAADPTLLQANNAAQQLIRIPGTEVIPQAQPAIAVGDVLRLIVRSNNEGKGQLYFRGMLIPASLPETLTAGDKIFAQVTKADNQVILKLLETQKTALGNTPILQPLGATLTA